MTKRQFPCIVVSCPDCGNVFMGAIFSAGILKDDLELLQELERYAKEGYDISVKNKDEFLINEFCDCKNK